MSEKSLKTKSLYNSVARSAYEAAMNEKFPMPLRQYYAKLALHYDAKVSG